MTIYQDETKLSELEQAIERYSQALDNIELPPGPSKKDAMEVLTARDKVQTALNEEPTTSAKSRATVSELDRRLKKQENAIASAGSLEEWRESLQPPESAWWWFFQPSRGWWMRFHWLWNVLTMSALALSASFIIATLQSLAIKGLSWQQSFGAILQGVGLAAIGSSALTSQGQEKIRKVLKKVGIPESFQSEATFAISLMVLGTVYTLYIILPEDLYKLGLLRYQQGNLSEAEENFLQALQLNPDDDRISIALGEIYESLGDLDNAIAQYQQVLPSGNPKAFNNLGRVYIDSIYPILKIENIALIDRIYPILRRENLALAETYLRMGLQRVHGTQAEELFSPQELINVKYQLHRNLGWALLEQKKYPEAESALKKAIEFDDRLPNLQLGSSISECLLAKLYKIQGDKQQQELNLRECRMLARPETLNEYKRLVQDEGTIADCIDTSSIVTGLDKLPVEFNEYCRAMAVKKPLTAVTDPALIETLRQKLSEKIQQNLVPNDKRDSVDRDLVYWVTVGEGGDVVAFEPTNKLASDKVKNTPLFALFESKTTLEDLVIFKVVFSPDGSFDVNPLSEDLKSLAEPDETPKVKTITDDPAKIEALRVRLFDEIDRTWRIVPSFDLNLVYQVSVDADGAIASYKPKNQLASDFVVEIPLPQLVSDNATAPLTQFKVVFSPFGALEVTPWQE